MSTLSKFVPYAWASHPVLYEDQIHFQVKNVSSAGARLSCSIRNNLILNGSVFDPLEIFLPTAGSVKVKAKVTYVQQEIDSTDITLGVTFLETSRDFKNKLAKYLLTFGIAPRNSAIDNIKATGVKLKYVKSHIDFTCVTTVEEYHEVLELRRQAYSRAEKVQSNVAVSAMSDIFDLNSIIIIAKHHGKTVGSVRMTFCKNPGDSFELDSSIQIPESIPRTQAAEVSRLCVSDDFQSTDLVLGLIERCTEMIAKTGAQYAISSCVEEMVEYYKKLGFFTTGLTFTLKTLNNIPHYFMIHDARSNRFAYKMNPIYWFYSYSNIVSHLRKFGLVKEEIHFAQRWYIKLFHWFMRIKK
jgi:hypothetical protein